MDRFRVAATAWTLAWSVAACAGAGAQPIPLPAAIAYPEGIAVDPASGTVYTAGSADGTLARIDPASGAASVQRTGLAPLIGDAAPGVLGMEIDRQGRLWLAGGRTRRIFAVDPSTGITLAILETQTAANGLINDVALAGDTAFFTDTLHPILWAVDTGDPLPARAEPWLDFAGTPLEYGEGPNLNGIVATPDGKSLIVAQMGKGLLFRIDIASKAVVPIDLKGETLPGADGLVLAGDTLIVVRQPAAEIVTVKLAPDRASGTVVKRSKPEGLAWPATAAIDGDSLLVVNTQFDKRQGDAAVRPFTILRVGLKELGVE